MTLYDLNVPNIPPTISGGYNCAGKFRLGPSPAEAAARGLRAKLDAAALEVLKSGRSWAEGPYEFAPERRPFDPFVQPVLTVRCRGGAVDEDYVPPPGWRLVRHSDWVAAGYPGLPPCRYCQNGQYTGLPGNACENCMNTGVEH